MPGDNIGLTDTVLTIKLIWTKNGFPLTEDVLSAHAWRRDGQLLHQLEQTVSDGVPASCAASQHHQGLRSLVRALQ